MSRDTTPVPSGPLQSLYDAFKAGAISRRRFVEATIGLGVSATTAAFLAQGVAAQDATAVTSPGASPAASGSGMGATTAPSSGTDGQTRGGGGELKLLQWQAPTQMGIHTASGDKDILAGQLILEPLMHYSADSLLIPTLLTEVPSQANGGINADSSVVTFKLLSGVTWSDGEPFTSADVQYTWQWIMDTANASTSSGVWNAIKSIDTPDDTTAVVTFNSPTPVWFVPFTGSSVGSIYPKHVLDGKGQEASDAFRLSPIGTGPYKVESFSPNDSATYVPNDNYREPNKPWFSKINLKGGGDAVSAARAVLQTGEYDFAWFTQLEPELLGSLQSDSSPGKFVVYPGVYAERLHLNFSDPDTEVDGQRSHVGTPNPRLSDPAVREAIATAIDRDLIAKQLFFADQGEAASNSLISGIPALKSPTTATAWEFNQDKAKQILDGAGWSGDKRSKDGVELKISYATTVNQVRQKMQAIVKKNLEDVGIGVELMQIDGGIYFDSSAGNDQNSLHMYYDMNMHQRGAGSPLPITLMEDWYAGPNNENVAQKENSWAKGNVYRYVNPDYDKVFEQAKVEVDAEKLRQQLIQLNDILITDHAVIPLVDVGEKFSMAKWITEENIGYGPFELLYWNIANWNGTRS
ncbi:MAG: peptide ABC transporter substrate-binding protein [Thermomicrobiales bacterium]